MPGRPDIAFPARRMLVQVHGCFCHDHGCSLSRLPTSRTAFWEEKFAPNRERDRRLEDAAEAAGWTSLTVWECETKDFEVLERRLVAVVGTQRLGMDQPTTATCSNEVASTIQPLSG